MTRALPVLLVALLAAPVPRCRADEPFGHPKILGGQFTGPVHAVALSSDGRRVAAATQNFVSLRDVESGRLIAATTSIGSFPKHLSFTADDRSLLLLEESMHRGGPGFAGYQLKWDIREARLAPVRTWSYPRFTQHGASADGKFVSLCGDTTIHGKKRGMVVKWESGEIVRSSDDIPVFHVFSCSAGCEGQLIVNGGIDALAKETWGEISWIDRVQGNRDTLLLPGGKRLAKTFKTGDALFSVIVHDRETKTSETLSPAPPFSRDLHRNVPRLAWAHGTGRLLEFRDGEVRQWDVAERKMVQSFRDDSGSSGQGAGPAFSGDGRSMVRAIGNVVGVTSLETGTTKWFRERAGDVSALAFSRDGTRLASARGSMVELWNVADGLEPRVFPARSGTLECVAIAPSGSHVAAGSADGSARVWTSETGAVVELRGHDRPVASVAFSPDGKIVATGGLDGQVALWTLTGERSGEWKAGGTVRAVAFSPDGSRLAVATFEGNVGLWSVRDRRLTGTLAGSEPVLSVDWRSDGGQILTCGGDGTIGLWNPATTTREAAFGGFGPSRALRYARMGRLVALGENLTLLDASGTTIRGVERRPKPYLDLNPFCRDALAVSAEGGTIAVATAGSIWLYTIPR